LFSAFCIFSIICLSSTIRPDDDLIRQVTDEVVSDPQILDARSALFNAEVHFRHFIRRYGKKYSGPEEHEHRFGVFKSNLLRALEHQKLDPRASHGVTKFSDLTQEEFRHQYTQEEFETPTMPRFCPPTICRRTSIGERREP
jgi:cathepsin F